MCKAACGLYKCTVHKQLSQALEMEIKGLAPPTHVETVIGTGNSAVIVHYPQGSWLK